MILQALTDYYRVLEQAGKIDAPGLQQQPRFGLDKAQSFHPAARNDVGIPVERQQLQQGQREASGLAGAGLCPTHDVVTSQNDRDGLALDGRGFGVAGVRDSLQDFRNESEFGKRHGYVQVMGDRNLVQCTIQVEQHYTSAGHQRRVR